MGATVLNGAQIGARCLIGANALVREGMVVPDGSFVVGVPAKNARALDADTAGKLALAAARYREKCGTYPRALRAIDAAGGGS
ncbi:putative lipopolysaccharide biosynthesis O-acetyl transferase WbbJ [compost metagenome]